MEGFAVNTIVASTISWTTLFLLTRNILRSRSFEFCNRIVSTVHAALAVILASLSVHDWNCPVCPLASQSSPNQMKIIAISLGYFIYDMICSQFDVRPNLENCIHHLVCIIGLGAGLVYQKCGSEMVAALWITELSSPFLHFRELLKELGYKDTDLNLAADVAFAVIFSIARMVGGPYITYVTISASNPFLIKVRLELKGTRLLKGTRQIGRQAQKKTQKKGFERVKTKEQEAQQRRQQKGAK